MANTTKRQGNVIGIAKPIVDGRLQAQLEALTATSATYEVVTPELAAQWLKKSRGNRRIVRGQVEAIAEDIGHDKWRPTHQGIAFNVDDVLIDGHHRLEAIVLAGRSVVLLVSRGVPLTIGAPIDTMVVRPAGVQLALDGSLAHEDERLA